MSDVKEKTGAVLRETAVLTGAVAIIAIQPAGGCIAVEQNLCRCPCRSLR